MASVFGFRAPYTYRVFEQRLADYLAFYAELAELYRSVIAADSLAAARRLFRAQYRVSETEVPEHKVLDFIFWSAGKLSKEEPSDG